MFISILYMFRAGMPVWYAGCIPYIPDGHPHRVTNTRCPNDTVISPDNGHIVARNMYRIEINIQGRNCVNQIGFIYKIIQGCMVNKA
jgi:hypothetical protein